MAPLRTRFRKKALRRARRAVRRLRPGRFLRSNPVFTEMFQSTQIATTSPGGLTLGLLSLTFNSLPQAASYSALYRRFKILSATWMLIPKWTSADLNSAIYNGTVVGVAGVGGYGSGTFCYAIDDTAGLNAPANFNDVITSNGSKVLPALRKIVIRHRPQPLLTSYTGAFGSGMTFSKQPWLNTDNATIAGNSGTAIPHGYVRYALSTPIITSGAPQAYGVYDVFCKVRIQLADPA